MTDMQNASIPQRAFACLLDWGIVITISALANLVDKNSLFFVYISYLSLSTIIFDGKTLGMHLLKSRLIMHDGSKPSPLLIITRFTTLLLSQITVILWLPNIIPLWKKEQTTWLDLTFKTRVITTNKLTSTAQSSESDNFAYTNREEIPSYLHLTTSIEPKNKARTNSSLSSSQQNSDDQIQIKPSIKIPPADLGSQVATTQVGEADWLFLRKCAMKVGGPLAGPITNQARNEAPASFNAAVDLVAAKLDIFGDEFRREIKANKRK